MIETERKYLILYPDISLLLALPDITVGEIEQTYLMSDGATTRRVRKTVVDGVTVLQKNTKTKISSMSRIEDESEIGDAEYRALLAERDPELNTICKTRYTFYYLGQKFEIDVYPFWHNSAICETELDSEDAVVDFPDFIAIKREVTTDKRYSNKAMAKSIPEED